MPYTPFIVHPFTAGLDTQAAATFVVPGGVTAASNAEYVIHLIPGAGPRVSIRKRPGTARYNATTTGATDIITSLADFWRHGASLSPTQKFVACAADKVLKDDGDGVWDVLAASGFGGNTALTDITIAEGLAIFANDQNQAPQSWDQTTYQALGTPKSPPPCIISGALRDLGFPRPHPSARTRGGAGRPERRIRGPSSRRRRDRLIGVSDPFLKKLYFCRPNSAALYRSGTTITTFVKDRSQ